MVSLGAAQSNAYSQFTSAVASNPDSSVIFESEISFQFDPYAGTEVVSESTRTIVVASAPGESIFVFPPAPDSGPDGGSAEQFSLAELQAATMGDDISIAPVFQSEQDLATASFAESIKDTLVQVLEEASMILVNSQEQLDMLKEATPLVAAASLPRIIIADNLEIPAELQDVTESVQMVQERLQEPASLEPLSVEFATAAMDRSQLLQELEDSGELVTIEQYVAAAIGATPLEEQLFSEVTVPEMPEVAIISNVENGAIITQAVTDGLDILQVEVAPRVTERAGESSVVAADDKIVDIPIGEGVTFEQLSLLARNTDQTIAVDIQDGELSALQFGAELRDLVTDSQSATVVTPVSKIVELLEVEQNLHSNTLEGEELDDRIKRLVDALQNAHETANGTLIGSHKPELAVINGTEINGIEVSDALEIPVRSTEPTLELSRTEVAALTASAKHGFAQLATASVVNVEQRVINTPKVIRRPAPESSAVTLEDKLAAIRDIAKRAINSNLANRNAGAIAQAV